jgi:RNA polymerase sigma-70 factor (ECF subfamily)
MFTTPASLLTRLREGPSGPAWSRFLDLYSPLLFAWAYRLGLSDPDVADLVQEVLATLVEQLPRFRYDPSRSFRAWLKTVLLNGWRKHRARRTRLFGAGDEALDQVSEADPRLELDEAEYRSHLVARALAVMQAEFEPSTWRACWEFVVADRPAAEVATELGLSVNAVYLAKSRVLRRLRAELEGLLD